MVWSFFGRLDSIATPGSFSGFTFLSDDKILGKQPSVLADNVTGRYQGLMVDTTCNWRVWYLVCLLLHHQHLQQWNCATLENIILHPH